MKSLQRAIESLVAQLPEVEQSLGAPDVVSDRKKFKELSIRYSYLSDVSTAWVEYEKLTKDLKGIHALLKEEKDEEMR
ncbi:MAG: PCRF domain-containing protein, partial [Chlamydiia bacterium]|nr:PCRF domain-containing protein [Chlamydiia bacterium]